MKQSKIKSKLKKIMSNNSDSLRAAVAQEALEYGGEPASFFSDLAQNGCISGMVGGLIYYTDTAKFYDAHYDEIETLRNNWEEETGEPLRPDGDLKNWFAWFAFEQIAFDLAVEIGL